MEKIKLKHDGHGDTRTAPKDTTFEEFRQANSSHRTDVYVVMTALSDLLRQQGYNHDWTKVEFYHGEADFWKDFQNSLLNNADFINSDWYQWHVHEEKHHPNSYCHDDINLLDLIEMIVDCVCAGKARAGEVRPMEINDEILKKAFENTVKLVDDITEVE